MEGSCAIDSMGIGSARQNESVCPRIDSVFHGLDMMVMDMDSGQGRVGNQIGNAGLQGLQTPEFVSKI